MLVFYLVLILYKLLIVDFSTSYGGSLLEKILAKHDIRAEITISALEFFPPKLSFSKLSLKYKSCSMNLDSANIEIFFRDLLSTSLLLSYVDFDDLTINLADSCFNSFKGPKQFLKIKELKGKHINIKYNSNSYKLEQVYYTNLDREFLNVIAKDTVYRGDFLSLSLSRNKEFYQLDKLSYNSKFLQLAISGTYRDNLNLHGTLNIKDLKLLKNILAYIENKKYSHYIQYLDNIQSSELNLGFKLALSNKYNIKRLDAVIKAKKLEYDRLSFDLFQGSLTYKDAVLRLYNTSILKDYQRLDGLELLANTRTRKYKINFKGLSFAFISKVFNTEFPYLDAKANGVVFINKELGNYKLNYIVDSKQLDIYAYFKKEKLKQKIMYIKDIEIRGNGILSKRKYYFKGIAKTKGGPFDFEIKNEGKNVKVSYEAKNFYVNQKISMVPVKSRLSFKGYALANMHYAFSKTYFKTQNFSLFNSLKLNNSKFTMYIENYVLSFKDALTPLKSGDKVNSDIVLDFSGDISTFKANIWTDAISLSELATATGFYYSGIHGVYRGKLEITGPMSDYFVYRAKGKIYNLRIPKFYCKFGDADLDLSLKNRAFNGVIQSSVFKALLSPKANNTRSKLVLDIKNMPYSFPHSSGFLTLSGKAKLSLLKVLNANLKGKFFVDRLGFFDFKLTKQNSWNLHAEYSDKLYGANLTIDASYLKKLIAKISYDKVYADFIRTITGVELYGDLSASGKLKIVDNNYFLDSRELKVFTGDKTFNTEPFSLKYLMGNLDFDDINVSSESCELSLKKRTKTYKLSGCLNSSLIRVFLPLNFSGYINTELAYKDSLNGYIKIKNTIINYDDFIMEINGPLHVKDGVLSPKELHLTLNNKPVEVYGHLRLLPNLSPMLKFRLVDIPITYKRFFGYLDGNFSVSGSRKPYLIKGKLVLRDSLYRFDKYYRRKSFIKNTESLFRYNLLINLRNIILDSIDMRFTLDGKININGALKDYKGLANLKEGRIKYMDREFELKHGRVLFKNTVYDYNVFFESLISSYLVKIEAKGKNTDKLNVSLRSNPPLTEEQIVSLLMTGRPFQEANSPISYVELTDEFKKQLGFNVGVNYKGLEENMSIELKKDLSKNLKLKYNRDIATSGEQKIDLEYRITDNIDIDASVKGDTAFDKVNNSIGIKFKHEF